MAGRIALLTSGGDAPGMNTAIRAVVRTALHFGMEVYGVKSGYQGLLNGEISQMTNQQVGGILHRGGTILYTARCEQFKSPEGQEKGFMMAQNFGLDALVVIGGDGSMRGAHALSMLGLTTMLIPATIDNDMGYTDYTIGYDTSVNTVLESMGRIRDTSESHNRTIIVEVMGRNCGDIAVEAGLTGGAETILVPERSYDINAICRKVIEGKNRGKRHDIIVKAEGVDISPYELADIIETRTGSETKVVILSYVQRGGSPSAFDRLLASRMGYKAVELIKNGSGSRALGIVANNIVAYTMEDAFAAKKEFKEEYLEIAEALS